MDDAVVTLVPLNDETRQSVDTDPIVVSCFPFRVGRDSRFRLVNGQRVSLERRNAGSNPNNELYIRDQEQFLNVSREHFQIERNASGGFELLDRGSTCGTIVDGQVLGAESGAVRYPLRNGSIIRVGIAASPFQFRVEIRRAS